MQKKGRPNKEELIKQLQANEKFQSKMKFVKEVAYPQLVEATTSIDDAVQNLSIINSILMENFLGLMKEKFMTDISLVKNLSEDDPKYEALKNFIELFDGYSVYEAKEILEGLRNEINLFIVEENKTRSLAELKTKWLDEL